MRFLNILIVYVLLTLSFSGYGLSFLPMPIKTKVENSDAVLYGTYISSSFKKDKNNQVVTEVTVQVKKSVGLSFNQLAAKGYFRLQYPGGQWGTLTHKVYGAPTFKEGETVVLLLKKDHGAFWVNELAAGKFNIIEKDEKKFIQSEIFPDKYGVGLMSMDEFEEVLEESHFRQALSEVQSEKHVAQAHINRNKRELASEELHRADHFHESKEKFNIYFLVLVFIFLGLGFTFFANIRRK